MTPEQEMHLSEVISEFSSTADTKYRKGQAEHGGNLFDMTLDQLLTNALEEAIDQVVYIKTARDKVRGKGYRPELENQLCGKWLDDEHGCRVGCMLIKGHEGGCK